MWEERLHGLVNRTIVYFFPNGTATEVSCELPPPQAVQCNTDQHSFKNYLHRWMATATQVAPIVRDQVAAVLRTSAAAAVRSCVDEETATCGFRWTTGAYDGSTGAGQQMNVLGALLSMLVVAAGDDASGAAGGEGVSGVGAPVTGSTGGNSTGDVNAGTQPDVLRPLRPVYVRDKVGAAILTTVLMGSLISMVVWINTEWLEGVLGYKNLRG